MASSATSSRSAATTAISSPCHCASLPAPLMTRTAFTPGNFSASEVSIDFTVACAYGERRTLPKSIPGRLMSNVYLARPLALAGPSMRLMRLPMSLRWLASGQSYLHFAMSPSLHRLGSLEHRLPDSHVGAATAQVAAQSSLHVFHGRVGVRIEEGLARHHEARRTEAALLRVVIHESRHHRVQVAFGRQALNGGDAAPVGFDRQHGTRVDRLAVHDHRAGAARGAVAHALGSRDVQMVATRVEQRDARLKVEPVSLPVDAQRDGRFARPHNLAGRSSGRAARSRLSGEQPGRYRNSCAPQEIAARQRPIRRGFPRLVLFPFHGSLLDCFDKIKIL